MPVEAVSPDSFRQDLVDQGFAIRTEDLWKTYEMGAEQVHALRGVSWTFAGESMLPSWDLQVRANPR